MVAADVLAREAGRRTPHPAAGAAVAELVMDGVRHPGDRDRRSECDRMLRDLVAVPEMDPDEAGQLPHLVPEEVERAVVENRHRHDLETIGGLFEPLQPV